MKEKSNLNNTDKINRENSIFINASAKYHSMRPNLRNGSFINSSTTIL